MFVIISIGLAVTLSGILTYIYLTVDEKKTKVEVKYASQSIRILEMVVDKKYLAYLLSIVENKAMEFCIDNNIPLFETFVKNGTSMRDEAAGRIIYNKLPEYYSIVNKFIDNPKIEINSYYYEKDKSAFTNTDLILKKSVKIHTLCHEIGHYLEMTETGNTTESGADWRGAVFSSSFLNEIQIWILSRYTSLFLGMDNKSIDNIKDVIYNEVKRVELIKEYSNFYKETV